MLNDYKERAWILMYVDTKTLKVVRLGIFSEDAGSLTHDMGQYFIVQWHAGIGMNFGEARDKAINILGYYSKFPIYKWIYDIPGAKELIEEYETRKAELEKD